MTERSQTVGQLLQQLRSDAELSLYELAKRTGINRSTLMRIEDGTTADPDRQTLNAIARALKVDAELLYEVMDAARLPEAATYFRSKYRLTDRQIAELTSTVERMTAEGPAGDRPKKATRRRTRP